MTLDTGYTYILYIVQTHKIHKYNIILERNEKEGAKTATGVDKPKVGTEGRKTWCMGFLLFPRFSSFSGKL